eukprot:GILJ01009061.1.p1 GENE.GILJ01009061.1~~GILJ01009061.1.p1  ORF type:complete len:435 (+),score=57.69 GILJ01009061.1:30-1334(+)
MSSWEDVPDFLHPEFRTVPSIVLRTFQWFASEFKRTQSRLAHIEEKMQDINRRQLDQLRLIDKTQGMFLVHTKEMDQKSSQLRTGIMEDILQPLTHLGESLAALKNEIDRKADGSILTRLQETLSSTALPSKLEHLERCVSNYSEEMDRMVTRVSAVENQMPLKADGSVTRSCLSEMRHCVMDFTEALNGKVSATDYESLARRCKANMRELQLAVESQRLLQQDIVSLQALVDAEHSADTAQTQSELKVQLRKIQEEMDAFEAAQKEMSERQLSLERKVLQESPVVHLLSQVESVREWQSAADSRIAAFEDDVQSKLVAFVATLEQMQSLIVDLRTDCDIMQESKANQASLKSVADICTTFVSWQQLDELLKQKANLVDIKRWFENEIAERKLLIKHVHDIERQAELLGTRLEDVKLRCASSQTAIKHSGVRRA